MKKEKYENYFIDFLRFIFSIVIMLYHGRLFARTNNDTIFSLGYLAVNFYFILTGYLMMNSLKKNDRDTKDFMKNKIKRLIPGVILTFFVCYFFTYELDGLKIERIFSNNVISELLMLKVTGYSGAINTAWWYLSTMLFILFLYYPLAKKYKEKFTNYLVPLFIILSLAIINYKNISLSFHSGTTILFINGFYKGIIYIGLGCLSYELANYFNKFNLSIFKKILWTLFEFLIFVFIVYNMHFNYIGSIWYAILLTLGVAISFSYKTYSTKIFRCKIWKMLGNYGFYLYLLHSSIRTYLLKTSTGIYFDMLKKYVILSLIVALYVYIALDIIYPFIKRIYKNKQIKKQNKLVNA